MTKTSKIVAIVLIAAILIIGVGYAAIGNITLNIAGSAKADPAQANFTVKFSGTPTTDKTNVAASSTTANVTAAVTDDLNATIGVTGLTAKGDTVSATYTIQNTSADLSANLSATTSNSDSEYFSVSYAFAKTSIKSGEATTVTVTVELIKTPIEASKSSTVGLTVTAAPAQPQA